MQDQNYSYAIRRSRVLYEIMKDEFLWALALVIGYARGIYNRRISDNPPSNVLVGFAGAPQPLINECEDLF